MANEARLAARPTPDDRGPSTAIPDALSRRVIVERLQPEIDGGRFPIKRAIGETVGVPATILADGHDLIAAVLCDRHLPTSVGTWDSGLGTGTNPERILSSKRIPTPESRIPNQWRETAMSMVAPGTDRWSASFDVTENGWYEYQIVAWVDRFLTWRHDIRVKANAGQDVSVELLEGSLLIRDAASRAAKSEAGWLLERADMLTEPTPQGDRVAAANGEDLAAAMARYPDRSHATESPALRVWVDRVRAQFGAWYEIFPRSAGPDPTRSGTFREACAEIPRIANMGFDVLYLPPI